jgi:hypothetical protein
MEQWKRGEGFFVSTKKMGEGETENLEPATDPPAQRLLILDREAIFGYTVMVSGVLGS